MSPKKFRPGTLECPGFRPFSPILSYLNVGVMITVSLLQGGVEAKGGVIVQLVVELFLHCVPKNVHLIIIFFK